MKKNPVVFLALALIGISSAWADTMPAPTYRSAPTTRVDSKMVEDVYTAELFPGNEWSVDVFGHYAFETESGAYDDGFGGGLGVNYFFNKYVGLGLEGYAWDADGAVGAVGGNLILRYPFEDLHLAPYLIGGVGGNFGGEHSEEQVNGGGGIGVEYRFNEHWGIFTDGRYIATDKTNDYGIARTGVRFTF
jgi:hypothetical protein